MKAHAVEAPNPKDTYQSIVSELIQRYTSDKKLLPKSTCRLTFQNLPVQRDHWEKSMFGAAHPNRASSSKIGSMWSEDQVFND